MGIIRELDLATIIAFAVVSSVHFMFNLFDNSKYKSIDSYVTKKTKYVNRLEKQIAKYREKITYLNKLLLSAKTEEIKNSIKKDIETYKSLIRYNEEQIKEERIQVTNEVKKEEE